MKRLLTAALIVLPVAAAPIAQQPRIASDFELAQMEKQLAQSRGFEAQVSARLNLGDVRRARSELALAQAEYHRALALATGERLAARRSSSFARYASATGYAALAQAKLGRDTEAFALLEETTRYTSDDAESWNLYASAMRVLGYPRKAASAARNAVAIASTNATTIPRRLDLAVYQYALASALLDAGEREEPRLLLVAITQTLRAAEFEPLARQVARSESFEIYSSARGDVAAYVSLLNRAQLRLAVLYEERGDVERALEQYERVLAARNDDVTALAAMARLSGADERERRYAEAFDANPFSLALVRDYRQYVATRRPAVDEGTPGGQMRKAIAQLEHGEMRGARATLDALLARFPANETLRTLRSEAEPSEIATLPSAEPAVAELRALLDGFERLRPEQRVTLDQAAFTSDVVFDSAERSETRTVFASGSIGGVPFRFSTPTAFSGAFDITARLTYRILGVTRSDDADVLLLEPLGVEALR